MRTGGIKGVKGNREGRGRCAVRKDGSLTEGESAHGYWRCLHNIPVWTILLSDVNEKIKCTAFDSFEHRKIELTVACKRLMALRHQATFLAIFS